MYTSAFVIMNVFVMGHVYRLQAISGKKSLNSTSSAKYEHCCQTMSIYMD